MVVAIHPSLLGENTHLSKIFLEEKFGAGTEDFILLTPQIPWKKEVIALLHQLFNEINKNIDNPLRLLAQANSICSYIGVHIQKISNHLNEDASWLAIWKMTGFIQDHYDLKITLDDIAAARSICRSRCCELFNKYIGQTPNTYLVRYRI